MIRHLDIKIYGRVIGVGFRWSAKEQADKLGVSGFIRNAGEDYIEAEAEAEEAKLDEFLQWCRKGPFWAKVEKVDVKKSGVKGFKDFTVSG